MTFSSTRPPADLLLASGWGSSGAGSGPTHLGSGGVTHTYPYTPECLRRASRPGETRARLSKHAHGLRVTQSPESSLQPWQRVHMLSDS